MENYGFVFDSDDTERMEELGLVVQRHDGAEHTVQAVATVPGAGELLESGFEPLDEVQSCYQQMWRAWPADHLRWVPETRPQYLDREAELWSGAGRLWFFRSPWPGVPMTEVLAVLSDLAVSRDVEADREGAMEVVRDVLTWDQQRLMDAVPPAPWEDDVSEG